MIREQIATLITAHLDRLKLPQPPQVEVEHPKAKEHGDYSSNVAMVLAKGVGQAPRKLAESLAGSLQQEDAFFQKVEVAGPGFLNFFIQDQAYHRALRQTWQPGGTLELPDLGNGAQVLIEFVSANPTGPMHVGHGRNAVVGDALARLMEKVGYRVVREFYVNDHGVQIQTLGKSGTHYHQILAQVGDVQAALPEGTYQGEYLRELVEKMKDQLTPVMDDPMQVGKMLGVQLLEVIKGDLKDLGVTFDHYYSESSLYEAGEIQEALKALQAAGHTYEQDGALWFRTTEFGDDKDRVLIKGDNTYTYLTPDIAYHKDKFERNLDLYINVMGADHGGYVKRLKAAVAALGFDPDQLEFLLMQLVQLKRAGEAVSMSKRSGDYVTLREVLDEVGRDVTRFFFLMRSHHQSLEFDLDLAKKETPENPVFYIQYAHARICSIFRKAKEAGLELGQASDSVDLSPLNLPEEMELIKKILTYPEVFLHAAQEREPHRIVFYLLEVTKIFQNYYTRGKTDERYRVISPDQATGMAKLYLLKVLLAVYRLCLDTLGVSAPEKMVREELDEPASP